MSLQPSPVAWSPPWRNLSAAWRARILWIAASALGAGAGAVLAVSLFPDLAFAKNPVGRHDPRQIGFALALGAPLGLAQAIALAWLFRRGRWPRFVGLALWVPVTVAAVVLMLLPLWDVLAEELILTAPVGGVGLHIWPGLALLGLGQWLLLRTIARIGPLWALLTAAGALAGASGGLLLGLLLSVPAMLAASALGLPAPPLEPIWALAFGACLGAAQCGALAREAVKGRGPGSPAEAL